MDLNNPKLLALAVLGRFEPDYERVLQRTYKTLENITDRESRCINRLHYWMRQVAKTHPQRCQKLAAWYHIHMEVQREKESR